MHVAGPISSEDEARMLEQVAYLTDLRARLNPPTRRRTARDATTPRPFFL